MNEYKNKLIIVFLLIISLLLLFCTFYKVEDAVNCNFTQFNDNQLVTSFEQLPTNKYLLCRIGSGEFYGKLSLIQYDGKTYIYQIKFKGTVNVNVVDNILIITGKENVFQYIINFLKSGS